MKRIIILGDGMADHAIERLGGKTPLQYADKPMMDMLAREGRCGRLVTVPEGFPSPRGFPPGLGSSKHSNPRLRP